MSGKIVVITGGARGIGLATAGVLHGLGAKVGFGDVDESALNGAGSRLGLDIHRRLDVTSSGVQFSAVLPTLTNTEMIAGMGHAKGFRNAESGCRQGDRRPDRQTETTRGGSAFDGRRGVLSDAPPDAADAYMVGR
jgi:NAD(P)-dependent dehydrogenase (short-subunit alcohol dehydrogenase family)